MKSLTDFSDRFSPLMVKDLRVMLKSPLFARLFILLHFCQIVVSLTQVTGDLDAEYHWIFWAITTLICLSTLRECSFEKSNDTGKNLELIRVSGLSPWQVVFGKWCTSIGLLTLYAASMLPYLVFRYFFGVTELAVELRVFAIICLSLGLLSAMTLGFNINSSSPSWARLLMFLVLVFGFYAVFSSMAPGSWLHCLFVFILFAFLIAYSLNAGASSFEQSTIFHALIKRLILIGTAVIILLLTYLFGSSEVGSYVLMFITTFSIIDCLTDPTPNLTVAINNFNAQKIPRPFIYLLFPQWQSTALLALISLMIIFFEGKFSERSLFTIQCFLFALSFLVIPSCLAFWLARKSEFSFKFLFIVTFVAFCVLVAKSCFEESPTFPYNFNPTAVWVPAIACIVVPIFFGLGRLRLMHRQIKSLE